MELFLEILLDLIFAGVVLGVIMAVAGYTVLAERKVASWIQERPGPNRASIPIITAIPVVGRFLQRLGVWQLVADGAKFLFKEEPTPTHTHRFYYILAPMLALIPPVVVISVLPFGVWWKEGVARPLSIANVDIAIVLVMAIGSLGLYGSVIGGWASNNKFSYMASVRAAAQLISYELAMGLAILPVILWAAAPGVTGGLNLMSIVDSQSGLWNVIWQPLAAFVFMVALFAETGRLPFDMIESETDLVSGPSTEYGAFKFGLFYFAEYINLVIGSALFVLLFLGGWNFLPFLSTPWPENFFGSVCTVAWFAAKTFAVIFFFLWMRWTLPRFRYDQVMRMGWAALVPLAVCNLFAYAIIIPLIDLIR